MNWLEERVESWINMLRNYRDNDYKSEGQVIADVVTDMNEFTENCFVLPEELDDDSSYVEHTNEGWVLWQSVRPGSVQPIRIMPPIVYVGDDV